MPAWARSTAGRRQPPHRCSGEPRGVNRSSNGSATRFDAGPRRRSSRIVVGLIALLCVPASSHRAPGRCSVHDAPALRAAPTKCVSSASAETASRVAAGARRLEAREQIVGRARSRRWRSARAGRCRATRVNDHVNGSKSTAALTRLPTAPTSRRGRPPGRRAASAGGSAGSAGGARSRRAPRARRRDGRERPRPARSTSSSDPARSPAKITWTTCLRTSDVGGRDRVDDRDRALERHLVPPGRTRSPPTAPAAARAGGSRRRGPRRRAAASTRRPASRAGEQDATPPAKDRRDPDPGLAHAQPAEDPKPRAPRSLAASSSTSTRRSDATGATTSCAMRMPRLDGERPRAVGVQEHDADLAPVARVDEAGRVDDRDPVAGGEARARLHEARVARRGSRLRGPSGRRRARRARARLARRRRGRGPRRPRTPAAAAPRRRGAAGPRARSRAATSASLPPRPGTAQSGRSRVAAGARARALPRACRAARRSARPGRRAAPATRPSSYGTSRRTSSKRSAKSSAMRALQRRPAPRPSRPRSAARAGTRARAAAAQRVEQVDLVQHELDRHLVGADLAQHRVDGLDRLAQAVLGQRRVGDVEDEVGDERLLERGREPLDELRRQAADEADRVGHEVALAVVLERPRGRVERLEEPVVHRRVRTGQRVQKRRLADVRVPGERDRRDSRALPLLPARRALHPEPAQPALEERDARARSRRSVSSWLSPGPRVPTPPPRRSRCCHMPACAAGCTRAARARPGACPPRCARAGRRCRGSAACGRRRAP